MHKRMGREAGDITSGHGATTTRVSLANEFAKWAEVRPTHAITAYSVVKIVKASRDQGPS